jgi:DNA-binding CsgD family transcriptional regulator/tetratricopeptide (TPR) repeat protein
MPAQLLEREAELDLLYRWLDRAAGGTGGIVQVSGEAGIGKTTLMRAFATTVRERKGARVLIGRCDDLTTARTLGPFRDMARSGAAPALAGALASATPRDEIFDAVLHELSTVATVMIVEDAHWADEATLDVIRFLARRASELPAVLAVTYRDDELPDDHPLHRVLGTLAGAAAVRLPLARLSPAAVRRLAEGTGADGGAVLRITGGNPFFVTELLAGRPLGTAIQVPATVREAVMARLTTFSQPAQRALELLAVIPGAVTRRLAEQLCGTYPLHEAERRGMIEADAESVRFRHELARHAIEQQLSATARAAHHRRVLAELETQPGAEPSRLAHHANEAGQPAKIIEYGLAAAREASAAGAFHQALDHYEAVLRWSGLLPDEPRAVVLEESVWVLYNCYRFAAAAQRAGELVALREAIADPAALGGALTTLSRVLYMINDPAGSGQAVDRAVELLEPLADRPRLALAYSYQAAIRKLTDRPVEAIEAARKALELADGTGQQEVVAHSLNYLGYAMLDLGDPAGIVHLRHSAAVAVSHHHYEYAQRAYTNLVEALYRAGRFDDLDQAIADGLKYARTYGFTSHEYNIEAHRCMLLTLRGRWAEAEAGLRALRNEAEPGVLASFGLSALGRLLARKADPAAGELLAAAWQAAERTGSVQAIALAGIARMEGAWLAGDPAAAELARVPLERTDRPGAERYRGELLRWLVRCGHPARPFPGCPDEFAFGIEGRWRAAAGAWRALGAPYEAALEQAGSGEPAEMREALSTLDNLGAVAAAALVRQGLRRRGVTPPRQRPGPADPHGLTQRQREVLALIAEGLTNAEIAARLVVSVRTVDHHVAAILARLGVTSRQAAIRVGMGRARRSDR